MVRKLLFITTFVAILLLLFLTGCTSPKAVVEHHYHEREVDTLAIQAIVDKRMTAVSEVMMQEVCVALESQFNEQSSQEQQKERITETITTWVDSLGREMRQEQRTTERDISRQQQLREERLMQRYEERMQQVLDSMNAVWLERIEQVLIHTEDVDSTAVSETPVVSDSSPWYCRIWKTIKIITIFATALLVLLVVLKWWMKYPNS